MRVDVTPSMLVDYKTEVARGNVAGTSHVNVIGKNSDVDFLSDFEFVWDGGTSYVPPTQARLHDIVSDDAGDAGTVVASGTLSGVSANTQSDSGATFVTAGIQVGDIFLNDSQVVMGFVTDVPSETSIVVFSLSTFTLGLPTESLSGDSYRIVRDSSTGASVVYVSGLDLNKEEISEYIVLNGVSSVATTHSYLRKNIIEAVGSSSSATLGQITVTAQTDGTISSLLTPGQNNSLIAVYSIPANKTALLGKLWCSSAGPRIRASRVVLKAGFLDGFDYVVHERSTGTHGSSDVSYKPPYSQAIGPGLDVWIEVDSTTVNTEVTSGFDLVLFDI